MVGIWPPSPPLIPDVSLSRDSSQYTMTWPSALYHDVAWTSGMKLDRKLSSPASEAAWVVSPSPSSVAFGVNHTKLGGLAPLRSLTILVEFATGGALSKYSHGLWWT